MPYKADVLSGAQTDQSILTVNAGERARLKYIHLSPVSGSAFLEFGAVKIVATHGNVSMRVPDDVPVIGPDGEDVTVTSTGDVAYAIIYTVVK